MKRVIICICLFGLLVNILTGCNRAEDKNTVKSIKIGVTVYDQYDTFISQLMECFNQYVNQKETDSNIAITVETYNASENQSTQNSQVATMIKNGCNVICVNLVDRTDPSSIIELAQQNHVPVIFFNRELVEEDLERWDQLYYVGAKAFESGIMQGEIATDYWKTNKAADHNQDGMVQYVVLEGEAGHQDAIVRTEYSVNTLLEKGLQVEKLAYGIANWNRAQAQTKMAQMIGQFGNQIELVFANNDDMALGAIDALKAAEVSKEQWPMIVGIDGTDVGLEAVKNQEMIGTVYNDKGGQAKAMVDLAFALATKQSLEELSLENGKYIRLPYAKITEKEVEAYQ